MPEAHVELDWLAGKLRICLPLCSHTYVINIYNLKQEEKKEFEAGRRHRMSSG